MNHVLWMAPLCQGARRTLRLCSDGFCVGTGAGAGTSVPEEWQGLRVAELVGLVTAFCDTLEKDNAREAGQGQPGFGVHSLSRDIEIIFTSTTQK